MTWVRFASMAVLLAIIPATAQAQSDSVVTDRTPINLLDRTVSFSGHGTDSIYKLPDRLLVPESEKITIGGLILVRSRDYDIYYHSGEVHIHFVVAADQTIEAVYRIFPFGLKPVYSRRKLEEGIVADTTGVYKAISVPADLQAPTESRLYGSGSITRGFTVGSNQDLSIQSGLNVQISGNLSDDVTLEASLTDENLPIEPEGNTETIQEIDQVFVRINKADRYIATVGDFDVNYNGTSFGGFARRLQGMRVSVNDRSIQADVVAATSKGKYATNSLLIIEGNQGPYQLTGPAGQGAIIVIAGSERVWIDGQLMLRGEQNDYVMDYNGAQITFTRHRLITPESRVVVDFEFSDDVFIRNSTAGFVRKSFDGNRFVLGSQFVRETDDKSSPLGFSIPQSLKDSLKSLDDKNLNGEAVIFVDGGQRVQFGRGAYRKEFSIVTTESIYVYVGIDSMGDYNVRFTDFGSGNGSYVRGNILGEFIYRGPGGGPYLPLVPLTLPVESRLGLVYGEWRPSDVFFLRSEFALSGFDKNAYSPQSVDGGAFDITASASGLGLKFGSINAGSVSALGRWRRLGNNFYESNRINDAEFRRTWNLRTGGPGGFSGGEELKDAQLSYNPLASLRLFTSYGSLQRESLSFESRRFTWGFDADNRSRYRFRYESQHVRSEVTDTVAFRTAAFRQNLTSFYRIDHVQPGFDLETERLVDEYTLEADSASGTSYRLFRPKIDLVGYRYVSLGGLIEYRVESSENNRIDSLDGPTSVATTQKYYLRINDWQRTTTQLEFVQRRREFRGYLKNANNPDRETRLLNVAADYYSKSRNFTTGVNYQLSNENVQDRKIAFVPVMPNTGNFVRVSADSFRQVPQGQGDWIQSYVRVQSFTPIVDLKFGFRWRMKIIAVLDEDTVARRQTGWRSTVSEGNLQVSESQQDPDRGFYFLQRFQKLSATINGSYWFRHDFSGYFETWDWRHRFERQKSLNVLAADGFEKREMTGNNLRVRYRFDEAWSLEEEADYRVSSRQTSWMTAGLQEGYRIRRPELQSTLAYKPVYAWEFALKLASAYVHDALNSDRAWIHFYEPQMIYSFKGRGRILANYRWTSVSLEGRTAPVFELTGGLARGRTQQWLLTGEYRLGNHVSALISYNGRKTPGQPVFHLGSAEFRAYF